MPQWRGRRKKAKQAAAAAAAATAPVKKTMKKKLDKIVWPEKEAPAADYASTCPKASKRWVRKKAKQAAAAAATAPVKKTMKKKLDKIVWPEKEAPAADYASTCPKASKRWWVRKREEENQKEKRQYLVVRHASRKPSYSLIEVKHTTTTAEHPVPSPKRVAALDGEYNMGFAAMCTDRRSWIVGVGGFPGREDDLPSCGPAETIVFDCKTEAVAKGPPPTSSKYLPLVFAIGSRVYALTRMPNIWAECNGPPWFEVLDLSNASCVRGRLTNCSWRPLPAPPLFPLPDEEVLSQLDHAPWNLWIESYAAVGRYILLSADGEGPVTGTVAFDVSAEEWYFVDRQNLPFVGEAVPYGRLFLGKSRSKESKDLTAYYISVTKTGIERALSIMEVPLTIAMEGDSRVISGQFFTCLGNGVLCATGCWTGGTSTGVEIDDDELYIHMYRPASAEEGEAEAQQRGTVLSSKGSRYHVRLHEPICRLVTPTLVAAPCVAI